MPNGAGDHGTDALWNDLKGLRGQVQLVSERTAVLISQQESQNKDIKELRDELKNSEDRLNQRFDRMRNLAIALVTVTVPTASALIGALLQQGGGLP